MTPTDVLESLLEAVGHNGTLLLPTFTYDGWCHGEPFDVRNTPSRMGALTEAGRTHYGAVRTGNPMYSFVAIGVDAPAFRGVDNFSGYGDEGPFGMLLDMDAWVASLDLPEGMTNTQYHYAEQAKRVYYRHPKIFSGNWTGWDGRTFYGKQYELWVRDLDLGWRTRVEPMGEYLWDSGLYAGKRPGSGDGLRIIRARAFVDEVSKVIASGLERKYLGEVV